MKRDKLSKRITNNLMMQKEVKIFLGEKSREGCQRTALYRDLKTLVEQYGEFLTFYNLRCVLLDMDDKIIEDNKLKKCMSVLSKIIKT